MLIISLITLAPLNKEILTLIAIYKLLTFLLTTLIIKQSEFETQRRHIRATLLLTSSNKMIAIMTKD